VYELDNPGSATPTIRLGLLEVCSSLSVACPTIVEDEVPRLRATFPALGDILPNMQTNNDAKQAFDNDRGGKQGMQGGSV